MKDLLLGYVEEKIKRADSTVGFFITNSLKSAELLKIAEQFIELHMHIIKQLIYIHVWNN